MSAALGQGTGTRLVSEVSVTLPNPDKPADGADLLTKLAFLEDTQFGQPAIVAVCVVDLVAIEPEHRIGRIFQIA